MGFRLVVGSTTGVAFNAVASHKEADPEQRLQLNEDKIEFWTTDPNETDSITVKDMGLMASANGELCYEISSCISTHT